MRINLLIQKLASLSEHPERSSAIDIDLMLDYTRVLYADLLEWRSKVPVTAPSGVLPLFDEPTLAEMAEAMKEEPLAEQPSDIWPERNGAPPKASARDIRSLIGINDKYQIMSELFGNDKAAYEEALHQINAADSEAMAVKWLQERLWVTEERSDAAQSFYDLVRRFKGMIRK